MTISRDKVADESDLGIDWSMIKLFMIPLWVGFAIQCIKLVVDFFVEKKVSRSHLWMSGGFPSVHSGIAASVTMLMLLVYWVDSSEFALAFTFSFLFWYDAANIRFEAGQHATFLNQITQELKELNYMIFQWMPEESRTVRHILKERLGHTVLEVIGGIIFWAVLTRLLIALVPRLIIL